MHPEREGRVAFSFFIWLNCPRIRLQKFVTVQSGCHSGEGRNLSAEGGSAFGGKISKQDASLRWHDTHPER
ncbi:MAG: hypothetical protein HY586_04830, partial [Candidatus Omnitrophica bacterium]|nr:hypothetical protein [Candidatus Omnitrophota bacterium]